VQPRSADRFAGPHAGIALPAAAATYYPRQYQCAPYQPPACSATFQIGSDNKLNYTAPYEASSLRAASAPCGTAETSIMLRTYEFPV
jgi:hypothetical protein